MKIYTIKMKKILQGESATQITASGKIVLTSEEALNSKEPVILFKHHTMPEDLEAIVASKGVVTIVGGTLSHASIVAREFNKAGVIACEDLTIDLENNQLNINGQIIPAGTMVTVDGMTGGVFLK